MVEGDARNKFQLISTPWGPWIPNTLPKTTIAHEKTPIFPSKYHQKGGFSMIFHGYVSFQGCNSNYNTPPRIELEAPKWKLTEEKQTKT